VKAPQDETLLLSLCWTPAAPKPSKLEKSEKPEKLEKVEKREKLEKREKIEKLEKREKPERPETKEIKETLPDKGLQKEFSDDPKAWGDLLKQTTDIPAPSKLQPGFGEQIASSSAVEERLARLEAAIVQLAYFTEPGG
jgi:hypothetical protein